MAQKVHNYTNKRIKNETKEILKCFGIFDARFSLE